jgi:putrescine aminotransferase
VIIPPEGYWPAVERVCRKYGILMVCDEVICGYGRLGSWFGFQHFGVSPDLVSTAKGLSSGYLPISAVGVASHIVEVLREKGGDFVHGYTYSGHPTSAAVALKNLEIIERENLTGRVRIDTGPYLAAALSSLADHPLVGETRSLGLIGAVEIVSEKGTNRRFSGAPGKAGPVVRDLCIQNGLMIRAVRDTMVMSPPLVMSRDQIDQMVAIIRRSLDEATPVLRERFPDA